MHKIFCIWSVGVRLPWLLLSFGITPMNADSFFTSWHDKIFQYLYWNFLYQIWNQPSLPGCQVLFLWKWYLETTVWELGVRLATELITTSRTFVWAELGSNFLKNKIHCKYIRFFIQMYVCRSPWPVFSLIMLQTSIRSNSGKIECLIFSLDLVKYIYVIFQLLLCS